MTDSSMTFGLISNGKKGKKTYIIGLNPRNGNRREFEVKANGINDLRKQLLSDYGHISTQTMMHVYELDPKSKVFTNSLGMIVNGYGGPVWVPSGERKSYRITPSGTLIARSKKKSEFPRDNYTSLGMPIYKIWYNGITDSYDVLARKFNGEWAYGHDYDRNNGMWKDGKYDYDIDNLYRRVGGKFGKVVVNNRRGPTGRF